MKIASFKPGPQYISIYSNSSQKFQIQLVLQVTSVQLLGYKKYEGKY